MKKKSDKIFIVMIMILAVALLAWIIPQGAYEYGVYSAATTTSRPGIYDIFRELCMAIYYTYDDVLFILVTGGCYGVLSKTKAYRKLVDKTSKLIKGKEAIAMCVTTLVISLFTSISNLLLPMFIFVPFIITVFLRNGKDRLTAIAASFGGILIGFMGGTYSTYVYEKLEEATTLTISSLIVWKIIIYVVALVLFNAFAIWHMKKTKKVDDTDYDLFATEELDESKIKVKNRTKLWPIYLVTGILFVLTVLGQINWEDSFGVTVFSTAFTKFQSAFVIADVPLFSTLLGGQFTAFGEWEDLLLLASLFFAATVVLTLVDKMKFGDFVLRFDVGIKKVVRLAIIYGLIQTVFLLTVDYQWIPTVINKLFGSGSFSILTILVVAIIAAIFYVNPYYSNYVYGYYLATVMGDKLADAALVWHLGQAFAMLLAPTSIIVMIALTYLDVPYKKWLKYIWKYALSFFFVVLILLLVRVYM